MITLSISGLDTILGAAVASLVRDVLPGAVVVCDPDHAVAHGGVSITFAESGRWLFVAASGGPAQAAVEALSRGASAVTTLATPVAEFQFALTSLVNGGPGHVPLDVARWMAGEALERANPARVKPPLTSREREILQLVARGYTNTEIAQQLSIATNTVRTHLHALSVKFEATNRTRMLANARALAVAEAFDAGDTSTDIRESA
jgi:DNA-binding NarL/FixJ family response regulator